ncbi:MAG: hypothetical protein ACOCYT_02435 [Chloroflexota bacterium]
MIKRLLLLLGLLLATGVVLAQDQPPQPFDIASKIRNAIDLNEYLDTLVLDVEPEDIFQNWDNSEFRTIDGAAISPDASMMAWHSEIRERVSSQTTRVLCVHTFETTDVSCHLPPPTLETFSVLKWSPDSRYITFTENRLREADDTDIWLYDVATRALVNLTDDGVPAPDAVSTEARPLVDFAPTWNPFNGMLYFFRDAEPGAIAPLYQVYSFTPQQIEAVVADYNSQIDALLAARGQTNTAEATQAAVDAQATQVADQATLQAAQATQAAAAVPTFTPPAPDDGSGLSRTPQDIAQTALTTEIVSQVQLTPPEPALMTTISNWGPGMVIADTTRETLFAPTHIDSGGLFMAIVVRNTNDPAQSGVWLLDLNTFDLINLASVTNFTGIVPPWAAQTTINNVQWAPDSTGVAISITIQGATAVYNNVLFYNLATGVLSPVVDLGELPDEADFFSGLASTLYPDSAVLLPDNSLFYFNRSARSLLHVAPIPPAPRGSVPTSLDLGRNLNQQGRLPSSVGFNDQVIRVIFDTNLIVLSR